MTLLFWVSLGVIGYTYAGYPLGMGLLAWVRPRPWRRAAWPSHTSQRPLSVIMAVHNGAGMLAAKLEHLAAVDPELIHEIIVVSDGSNDGTNEILRAAGDPRLRVIVLEQQGGKARALNHGVAAATAEILLFVDIRPRIEPGALASLLANFADPAVGCVAGELLLETDSHDAAAAAVSGLYWRYEQWIRNQEAAWDSPVGVYGGFYAIRRSLATTIPEGLILDDMFQPLSVIRQGYRSVLDRSALVTDRWPAQAGGEFQRKVRTLAGNLELLQRAPWLLTPSNRLLFQLVSHKLLRLLVPVFFMLLLISSCVLATHSRGYAVFAALQVAMWSMAAIGLRVRIPGLYRIASPASALLVLNAAAVAGICRFFMTKGPLWRTWTPTAVAAGEEYFRASELKKQA